MVDKIDEIMTFDFWLTVDIKPFKRDLLKLITSWSDLFKTYLVNKVVNRYRFINQIKI